MCIRDSPWTTHSASRIKLWWPSFLQSPLECCMDRWSFDDLLSQHPFYLVPDGPFLLIRVLVHLISCLVADVVCSGPLKNRLQWWCSTSRSQWRCWMPIDVCRLDSCISSSSRSAWWFQKSRCWSSTISWLVMSQWWPSRMSSWSLGTLSRQVLSLIHI